MGLKTLISNLEGGMSNYPSHNTSVPNSHNAHTPIFNAKSLSVYPPEGRGNNFPLIGPVTWDINDTNANPTFSGAAIDYSTSNTLDGFERGGITITTNRLALDVERIARFYNTPTGANFVSRQVGLQLSNPQINAPHGQGLLNSSPANQRTYNLGINTAFQIGLGGSVLGHIKREGTLPTNNRGYVDDDESQYALGSNGTSPLIGRDPYTIVTSNRLAYLWNNKMVDTPITSGQEQSGFAQFISKVGDTISDIMNVLGNKGAMLYDYSAGPGSKLGLGRTFIGRYTETGTVKSYSEHALSYDTRNDVYQNFQQTNGKPFTWDWPIREWHRGGGNPGKKQINRQYVQSTRDDGTLNYSVYYAQSIDSVNAVDIFTNSTNELPHINDDLVDRGIKDFVPFYFEALNTKNPLESDVIYFRAFLDSINDNFKASHNKINYNGRAEDFYTYKSFNRSLSFNFKIAAQTRHEMMPLYRKLNYLASNTAPEYDDRSNRIRTPFMRLTIGDLHVRLPGVLTSVGIKWQKDYPWEVRADGDDKDRHMLVLPHVLDVSVNYQPIHNFTPQKGIDSPFILPSHELEFLDPLQKWLAVNKAPDIDTAMQNNYTRLSDTLGEDFSDIAENQLENVYPTPPAELGGSGASVPQLEGPGPTTINTSGLRADLNVTQERSRGGDIFN